mgnify:FL=1
MVLSQRSQLYYISGQVGIITEITDLSTDSYRGAVKVEWVKTSSKPRKDSKPSCYTYRIGADGKVEVKLVQHQSKEAFVGSVILEHLTVVGKIWTLSIRHFCKL